MLVLVAFVIDKLHIDLGFNLTICSDQAVELS